MLLALGRARTLFTRHLYHEGTALDSVNEDKTRLEARVRRPGAKESNSAASLVFVVLWIHVEEASLTHPRASRIIPHGGDINYIEAVAIVGLVKIAVEDVLVVVDRPGLSGIVASVHRVLEVANVKDVSGGQTLCHWTDMRVAFIKLVICRKRRVQVSGISWTPGGFLSSPLTHEEVLLVHYIVHGTLMDILRAREGRDGNDVGNIANLIRRVVDGDRVLIISVADVTAFVPLVWASVNQTLSIMDVAIACRAARTPRIGRVCHVEINQSTTAGKITSDADSLVTTYRTHGDRVIELLVDNNVVGAANRKLVPMACQISLGEVGRASRVQSEQFLHVEDLDSVVDSLRADDSIVA